ncbi:hypothetical protein LCGC14_1509480 [marine sediment metagenome]|uniref:HNH nuclease domain-containing protein n=1 Tax=marine sediment metagenome TaxID=412755 RepID=A0A0F9M2Z7_9ZZZZ
MRICSVEGCEKKRDTRGYCAMHNSRMDRNGSLEPKRIRGNPAKRFHLSYVIDPESECWLWIKSLSDSGYGQFSVDGESISAHRYSWELHNGPIPDGLCVLHKCDVKPCVNPDHLFTGTNKDNSQDALKKGRLKLGGLRLGPYARYNKPLPAVEAYLKERS